MTIRKGGISKSRSKSSKKGGNRRLSRSSRRRDSLRWFGQSIDPDTFHEVGIYDNGKFYELEGEYSSDIFEVIDDKGYAKFFDIHTVRSLMSMEDFFVELDPMADERGVVIMQDNTNKQLIYVPVRYNEENMEVIDQMGENLMTERGYDSYLLVGKEDIQRTGTIRRDIDFKREEPPLKTTFNI